MYGNFRGETTHSIKVTFIKIRLTGKNVYCWFIFYKYDNSTVRGVPFLNKMVCSYQGHGVDFQVVTQ